MTDNPFLPAQARADARFGDDDRNVPLSQAPIVALAFALGYATARPQSANTFGPFCAMVEELMGRGTPQESEWTRLMRLLPMPLARSLGLLYQVQRGQRWARTGERHPK
ncbi:hypothetical protein I5G58_gp070 [Mycobacterium phage BirdsNest]|uniref:DUF7423 domain-containing protein n=1 Tax=Mycobacterium phage BirdsNest TaxID=2686231 RepID=A0A6B9L6T3_9CAUD|nr:hypothetical protein I5G58_gp070 [Mycobacterium phage BirdsNest]QHB37372.1 hypothetical protein PBI_BIRDSNEST_70 [Mycobacterium phage BirdsNest]